MRLLLVRLLGSIENLEGKGADEVLGGWENCIKRFGQHRSLFIDIVLL